MSRIAPQAVMNVVVAQMSSALPSIGHVFSADILALQEFDLFLE